VPVDNDVYERLGGSWWDETSPLNLLHGSVTPGRFAYFRDVLARRLGAGVAGARVLDIGCGGGFLAEEFAALGCRVTGIDPSQASIGAARAHAIYLQRGGTGGSDLNDWLQAERDHLFRRTSELQKLRLT